MRLVELTCALKWCGRPAFAQGELADGLVAWASLHLARFGLLICLSCNALPRVGVSFEQLPRWICNDMSGITSGSQLWTPTGSQRSPPSRDVL